ncbi:MAG TPA: hypothetical protein VM118_03940 [Acidobacteriota bacterium]|nr:hypothetical protein [Acidobacteriota bacterium]
MKARVGILVYVILVLGVCTSLNAAVPGQINVQGRLTDSGGIPLAPGSKTFSFKIYTDSTGGIAIWPQGAIAGEEQTLTTGQNGLWTALIGALYPLSSGVFADSVRWLEITVQDGANPSVTMPRVRLVTGPLYVGLRVWGRCEMVIRTGVTLSGP